jgi:tetratricopeptide (TPR) repeat protein
VKLRAIATAGLVAGLLAGVHGGVAEARNSNCSGGILYVTQALGAREKQDLAESRKLFLKAVNRLSLCASEDPNDFEAQGYLGWAYAEVDSAGPAGVWFQKALAGLRTKGDKKALEMVSNNRRSFWVNAYNAAIGKMKDAEALYPDFNVAPASEADSVTWNEARNAYAAAIAQFTRAQQLDPSDPTPLKSTANAYTLMGRDSMAEQVYLEAAKTMPDDTTIVQALRAIRNDRGMRLIDRGQPDAAIAVFTQLIQEEPANPNRYAGLGDACFEKAQTTRPDSAARPIYKAAGDAYAKASDLNRTESSIAFNSGISYYSAHEFALAEPVLRRAVGLKADNGQYQSYLASTLAALKKFDEAAQSFASALAAAPKDPEVHRQLGIAYNFAGVGQRASQAFLVARSLDRRAKSADDPAAVARAATGPMVRIRESAGIPDQVNDWAVQSGTEIQKIQTWYYWSKKTAYHLMGNDTVQSDWSTLSFKPSAGNK